MLRFHRTTTLLCAGLTTLCASSAAQTARISEETRTLTTYPFSEPNPVPVLTRDTRLYPYHAFEGYAADGVPRLWKVVHLENDLIEVFVLPEVGGKVWGAVVKRTGHEFIYRNEVMKFRNIALRGPWTSGGIEFNFGVIGHAPSTATPVDYLLRENADGSVSCIVGTMDLPSRTHWRVEIRLPADRASFETNVSWSNPTPLEQPYYNWMTAAAFALDDLEMFMPGNAYLAHSGERRDWPVDSQDRFLPRYVNNRFGGHKSYHVVGALHDFFGGYYHDAGYGFGHWARHEEMPGQKLWLWALSREGGVWEELLTDGDGQYIEFQAGRLFVQYAPGAHLNPITQAGFAPGVTDRWSETWFPLEGLGGLTDASRDAAMYLTRDGERLSVRVTAFGAAADTLRVTSGDRVVAAIPVVLAPLEPVEHIVDLAGDTTFAVRLPLLGLEYSSDPDATALSRPFETDASAPAMIPDTDRLVFEGRELAKGRRYGDARALLERALAAEPWHRDGLVGLADLEYRRGRYDAGLSYVRRALQLDTYDAEANFVAGNLYRAAGRLTDAREAFGWAARSMAYRSTAYVQLAELALAEGDAAEAARYARLTLDYDHYALQARQLLATVARKGGDRETVRSLHDELLALDPLHHFVAAETFLSAPGTASARALAATLRSEYPDQTILELAIDYVRRGATGDARTLLQLGTRLTTSPLLAVWSAWLDDDPARLAHAPRLDFVFPYRRESLPVLEWAAAHTGHWSWTYLYALNLWARDRAEEAADLLAGLGDTPAFAPLYVSRAHLLATVRGRDPERDFRRAVALDPSTRLFRIELIRFLQQRGRWADALAESDAARAAFPGDFNLDLLRAGALVQLDRPLEAIAILNATHVLPSENARTSHQLYEQAHTLAALDALDAGAVDDARTHLLAALEWPEHLGQGRPYDPEERLVRYLLAHVEHQLGTDDEGDTALETVVDASMPVEPGEDPLDLLAIAALFSLERGDVLRTIDLDTSSDGGRLGNAIVRALVAGDDVPDVIRQFAAEHPGALGGLGGQLLLRALALRPTP